jgi:hypothetical protein
MGIKGAYHNYHFADKNLWRGQVWTEIANRIGSRADCGKAMVVYLAGAQDLDRKVAKSLGFKDHNLIIVEKNKSVYAKLKAEGKPVICGDLVSVLLSWPTNQPWGPKSPGAIVADYCHGFDQDAADTIYAVSKNPCLCNSVVAMNLMRGRDTMGPILKEIYGWYQDVTDDKTMELFKRCVSAASGSDDWSPLHRGFLSILHACTIFSGKLGARPGRPRKDGKHNWRLQLPSTDEQREWAFIYFLGHNPRFFSYKSSGPLYMDSVVFKSMFNPEKAHLAPAIYGFEIGPDPKLSRSISAHLAVRTMRAAGTKPGRKPAATEESYA